MVCIGSQLTFCSPGNILRRAAVERDDCGIVTRIFSLDESQVESAHTLFYDGIISAEMVSLKQHVSREKITELTADYCYVDASEDNFSEKIINHVNPIILDFGGLTLKEINRKLAEIAQQCSSIPVFDVIAGCVFYPALLLGFESKLTQGRQTKLLLWEHTDLVNKTLTVSTKIQKF